MKKSRDTVFLGHPGGLGWLSASEFWERFSYYGMQALLVLYMTHQLLLPGHVEHVLGFGAFRGMIELVRGPLTPLAMASQVFGLYAGLVYVTPILGGLLADRVIGRTRAVVVGAGLMTLGHFLMAFDASFLIALLCLLIGVGCFKGNIAVQVGELYDRNDPRRADAFQIYMFGIQLAGIVTPLICGTLGEVYGWHWGFAAAGIGMLAGLTIYLVGRPALPPEPPLRTRSGASARPPLTPAEWRNVMVLTALLPVLALAAIGNQQIYNSYLVWGEANFRLTFFGMTMPVTWLLSGDGILSAVTMAGSVLFWHWWARRHAEPDEMTKIALGTACAAAGPLLLAAALLSGGHRVSLAWGMGYQTVNDIGFANIFPVGLALYSRAAPKSIAAIMIAVYYLHLFLANYLVGYLGGLLEQMPGTSFWLLHAGLMAAATVVLLAVRSGAGRALAPSYDKPHEAAA